MKRAAKQHNAFSNVEINDLVEITILGDLDTLPPDQTS